MITPEIAAKIKSGARVRVWEKVKESDKERSARFEGIVLSRKHGNESGASFRMRAVLAGVGVEKVFLLHSPRIDKVEILSSPKKVHRSKMYYVRDLSRTATRQKIAGMAEGAK